MAGRWLCLGLIYMLVLCGAIAEDFTPDENEEEGKHKWVFPKFF